MRENEVSRIVDKYKDMFTDEMEYILDGHKKLANTWFEQQPAGWGSLQSRKGKGKARTAGKGQEENPEIWYTRKGEQETEETAMIEWDTVQPKRHWVSKGGIASKRKNSWAGEVSCTDRVD